MLEALLIALAFGLGMFLGYRWGYDSGEVDEWARNRSTAASDPFAGLRS